MPVDITAAGGEDIAPGLVPLRELGGGVVFEAWLAFDERLLAPVVVKRMRAERAQDERDRADFHRELQVLGSLSHPGIARLFSYDDECERPYLVIEHVDGPTLSSLISRHGNLPLHQLLPLAADLASALHYLRGADLCHLDLKPSNVVMGAPARLIDFSVAMSVAEANALTHPVGSDEYMAPEQCEPGRRGAPGPASDVWGFGATIFRAAAGYRAFDREPRWRQLEDDPHALPEHLGEPFRRLVLDCLSSDPTARPTPREIVDRIDPLLGELPRARLAGFSLRG